MTANIISYCIIYTDGNSAKFIVPVLCERCFNILNLQESSLCHFSLCLFHSQLCWIGIHVDVSSLSGSINRWMDRWMKNTYNILYITNCFILLTPGWFGMKLSVDGEHQANLCVTQAILYGMSAYRVKSLILQTCLWGKTSFSKTEHTVFIQPISSLNKKLLIRNNDFCEIMLIYCKALGRNDHQRSAVSGLSLCLSASLTLTFL